MDVLHVLRGQHCNGEGTEPAGQVMLEAPVNLGMLADNLGEYQSSCQKA